MLDCISSVPDAFLRHLQPNVAKMDESMCPRGSHGPPTVHTTIRSLMATTPFDFWQW